MAPDVQNNWRASFHSVFSMPQHLSARACVSATENDIIFFNYLTFVKSAVFELDRGTLRHSSFAMLGWPDAWPRPDRSVRW